MILRRSSRHGQGALGERGCVRGDVIRRDHRLSPADEDPQTQVVAFRALRFFDAAVAYLDGKGKRPYGDRVGLIGAGRLRRLEQALGTGDQQVLVKKSIRRSKHDEHVSRAVAARVCSASGKCTPRCKAFSIMVRNVPSIIPTAPPLINRKH